MKQRMNNYNQQPEVIACQGEGEIFKTHCENNESCGQVARITQNPSADIFKYESQKALHFHLYHWLYETRLGQQYLHRREL